MTSPVSPLLWSREVLEELRGHADEDVRRWAGRSRAERDRVSNRGGELRGARPEPSSDVQALRDGDWRRRPKAEREHELHSFAGGCAPEDVALVVEAAQRESAACLREVLGELLERAGDTGGLAHPPRSSEEAVEALKAETRPLPGPVLPFAEAFSLANRGRFADAIARLAGVIAGDADALRRALGDALCYLSRPHRDEFAAMVELAITSTREQALSAARLETLDDPRLLDVWRQGGYPVRERVEPLLAARVAAGSVVLVEAIGGLFASADESERSRAVLFARDHAPEQFVDAVLPLPPELSDFDLDDRLGLLRAVPGSAVRLARGQLGRDEDSDTMLVDALLAEGTEEAAAVVRERLDALMGTIGTADACHVLEELGDVAALPLLLDRWRPEERTLAEAIIFLSKLPGAKGEVPEAIARDAAQPDEDDPPPELDLRCLVCGRTFTYRVNGVDIAGGRLDEKWKEDWDGVFLHRVIECKGCGAVDRYELTRDAEFHVFERGLHAIGEGSSRFQLVVGHLWDGTPVRRASAALTHLREAVAADDHDAARWRRLGNFLLVLGRDAEATEALERAADLDPNELEARWSLLDLDLAADHFEAAGTRLPELLRLFPQSLSDDADLRTTIARELVSRLLRPELMPPGQSLALAFRPESVLAGAERSMPLAEIVNRRALIELLEHQVAAARLVPEVPADSALAARLSSYDRVPSSVPTTAPPKVGRNAPCPCGSGQKFKKCHGA